MELSLVISIASGILQLFGYWVYNRGIYTGKIKPNVSTWFLWMVGSAIITFSYMSVSEDLVKNILPITCTTACMLTFWVALWKGERKRPDRWDVFIIILDLATVAFWATTGDAELSNILFMFDICISFMPLLRSTWRNPEHEDAKAWFIWTAAYSLMLITVLMRFERMIDLAYPIVLIVLHGAVGCIARFKSKTAVTCG